MSREIERLGSRTIEHEAPLRVIVVAAEDELERMQWAAPVVRRFARVNVPPLRASDTPIVWLCNALDRALISLEQTLFALWLLTDEEVVVHAPWRPHPRLQGWEGAAPPWVRRLTGKLRSGPQLSKDSRIFDARQRFHLDDARLDALERLTTSLRRMIGAAHDEPSASDEGGR